VTHSNYTRVIALNTIKEKNVSVIRMWVWKVGRGAKAELCIATLLQLIYAS